MHYRSHTRYSTLLPDSYHSHITPVVMTEMVIDRVKEMAKKQGIKSLKFYNWHRKVISEDLLEEVGSQTDKMSERIDKMTRMIMLRILWVLTPVNCWMTLQMKSLLSKKLLTDMNWWIY